MSPACTAVSKFVGLVFAVAIAVFVSAGSAMAAESTASWFGAIGPITSGVGHAGTITGVGDEEWYFFYNEGVNQVSLQCSTSTDADASAQLFLYRWNSGRLEQLSSGLASSSGGDALLEQALPSGVYYVRIKDNRVQAPYALTVSGPGVTTSVPVGVPAPRPSVRIAESWSPSWLDAAGPCAPGTPYSSTADHMDDADWYQFSTKTSGRVTVAANCFKRDRSGVYLALYKWNTGRLERIQGVVASELTGGLIDVSLTAGTYYVLIAADGGSAGEYDVSVGGAAVALSPQPMRFSGNDRYSVAAGMVEQLQSTQSEPFEHVVVVCGEDRAMADPLGAVAFAKTFNAPILLTPSKTTSAATMNALRRMRTANGGRLLIHVIGGTTSVSPYVYGEMEEIAGAELCERISGANRYDLSMRIAERVRNQVVVGGVLLVNIEDPRSFNDALAVSPMSANQAMPLIGVKGTSLPKESRAALAMFPSAKRYAVNSAFLSAGVRSEAACEATPMANNLDRAVAATQIARYGVGKGWASYRNIGLTNRLSDALPAGALVGQMNGVILYTAAKPLSKPTKQFITEQRTAVRYAWIFGGPASVDEATRIELRDALVSQ